MILPLSLILGFVTTPLPPYWQGYGADAQHAAIARAAAQPVQSIHWSMSIDKYPKRIGTSYEHYPGPVITAANTVIESVKLLQTGYFSVVALRPKTGSIVWRNGSDYVFPPFSNNAEPTFEPFLTKQNVLYYAGIGGTVYQRLKPDVANVGTTQLAFYGIANYRKNPGAYGLAIQINTPITGDNAGNIYFGFRANGTTPLGLKGGLARIDANGNGTWISAADASGDKKMTGVQTNCAPAISRDGKTVYVAVSNGVQGYLVGLDSKTLAPKYGVKLMDPQLKAVADITDQSSASPTIGTNGDVYFGVQGADGGPAHNGRGWLLHFDATLTQSLTPGSFGWDDTASLVPPTSVPSYTGSSPYLMLTKYNNYIGLGSGDGMNKVAVLDPYATQTDPYSGLLVMAEVITILGPTHSPEGGVYEWCVNTLAVDPATKSALLNSEDGNAYRWDFTTNSLNQKVGLGHPVSEAYTPTVIGPDGTNYILSNATLFAIGN